MAVAVIVVSVNSLRFERRVAREARELEPRTAGPRAIERARIRELPPPVQAYLERALSDRATAPAAIRFRHGGRFRPSLSGPWYPIRGDHHGSADPPGFVWWGRLRLAPGVWIDARDRSVNGIGRMLVSFESSFVLADRSGPELDQGALLRLLSELVLLPAAFLDGRYVTWEAVDETHARASLRVNGREAEGVFEFGGDRLPRAFSAERYLDDGTGPPELTPWSGTFADYREVAGALVPHRFLAEWHVDGTRVPYVDFVLGPPSYEGGVTNGGVR